MLGNIDLSRRVLLKSAGNVVVSSALFPLTACDNTKATKEAVLYITLTLGNPFYQEMIEGLRAGLASIPDWELEARAGKSTDDATGQRDIMGSILTQHEQKRGVHLRGLVIVPATSGPELADAIRAYNNANIPVINVDIPIDQVALDRSGAKINAFVGSNNIDGGRKAADVLADKVPDGGDLLILLGASGSANTRDRRDGFIQRIQELSAARKVKYDIREWTANWTESEAVTATDSLISGGSPLFGIFAENDLMALGAAQAVYNAQLGNRPKPVIVGYDAIPEVRQAIRAGRVFASISQNPAAMGQKAIEYLQQIARGEPVPMREIIPVSAVTRENA